jgi:hypothetical protein
LLLLSWSHFALFSARNIPIFAAIATPAIGLAMREWIEYAGSHWPLRRPGRFAASLAEIEAGLQIVAGCQTGRRWHLVACSAFLLVALLLAHPGHVTSLRAEFDHHRFPFDAATFLSQERLRRPIRLYSSWQWGGYLIYRLWPALSVFNDGRTDFYGPSFVEEGLRAWDASPDWRDVLERYRVDAVLLPADSALASVLRQTGDWKLVYQDRVATFFEKADNQR